jgi:hypothetical protein
MPFSHVQSGGELAGRSESSNKTDILLKHCSMLLEKASILRNVCGTTLLHWIDGGDRFEDETMSHCPSHDA